jgi:hypothetical protein
VSDARRCCDARCYPLLAPKGSILQRKAFLSHNISDGHFLPTYDQFQAAGKIDGGVDRIRVMEIGLEDEKYRKDGPRRHHPTAPENFAKLARATRRSEAAAGRQRDHR